MEAYRQIVRLKNNTLKLLLPNSFKEKKVEVIIVPFEEKRNKKNKEMAKLRGKLNLTKNQYINFQDDVKKSRKEWE